MEKILFFDFDGTLINTVGPVTQLFKDTADHWSDHIVTKDDVISTFGVNERGTLKQLTGDNGEKAFLEFFEAYKLMLNSVKPYPGIVDLLETLRDDGFTLILVTGKGIECCEASLDKMNLKGVFEEICPGRIEKAAKAEDMLEIMKRHFAEPEDCFYIGDTPSDVIEAQNAGVECLSAAWDTDTNRDTLNRINPGKVFESIEEIKDYITAKKR